MTDPQDLPFFKDAILKSDEIHALVKERFGEHAEATWDAFQRGENLDDLYELITEWKDEWRVKQAGGFGGAAPDDDAFPIEILRIGPLFFVKAPEFDSLEYFGSYKDAEAYAYDFFSGYLEQLNEREDKEDE